MSDRYNQYRILYSLYDEHFNGQLSGININNLIQKESLKHIIKTTIFGEISYLQGHGLIGIDRIYSPYVRITSRGIYIVNAILDNYHVYLKDRKDADLEGAYNNISAMLDSIRKRSTTNFHIMRNTNVFKSFLSDTKIFDRLQAPNYIQSQKDINKQIIEQHIKTLSELPVAERINKLEDKYMERKASFKYDIFISAPTKEREKQISKSIAGFSNTDGGILFIGVDNDGIAVGLKNDYSLVKNNADGFQLELRDSIKHFLKNNIINDLIDIRFHKCNAEEICEIIVYPSPVPIILSHDRKEEFYIREGNSTKPYTLTDAIEYCIQHFTPQYEY